MLAKPSQWWKAALGRILATTASWSSPWSDSWRSSEKRPIVFPSRRKRAPEVPWPEIISLRNRLIHGYDAVDLDIVWRVLDSDLPTLVEALERGP